MIVFLISDAFYARNLPRLHRIFDTNFDGNRFEVHWSAYGIEGRGCNLTELGRENSIILERLTHEENTSTLEWRHLEWDCEVELAALTFPRGDPDAAAVQLHDLLGDGQAQPRAAALLQLARADLHEVLE